MKIGLVGYQGSGKSTLFEWLTEVPPDLAASHIGQSAMAPLPDSRVAPLCDIYDPKKVTLASLELVDTPGLSRTHEGNAARLAMIREAGCLVLVVAGFADSDPLSELQRFEEDLLLADLEIVTGRIERLRESVKKPRPNRDEELAELAALEPLLEVMESGHPISTMELTESQKKATRSFRLLTEKPKLVVVNAADDDEDLDRWTSQSTADRNIFAVRVSLELELAKMSPEDREEFQQELGITGSQRDDLLRTILDVSGHLLFFTAGEKEVRTWLIARGGTALDAADGIHSDLARGFIRAETMTCDDLIRLGSEREVKAQSLYRQEHKDYVVADGDILLIRFSV